MFNIYLNYNSNQALDSNSWDGNFHAVSLYGSMKHLASDALNIKESLIRIKKYITGKSIKGLKANDIKDLMGMDKALWEFINVVYKSQWDALYVNNNTLFRSKAKEKFNSQIKKTPAPGKEKEIIKLTYISPIPPPILAKSSKEIKEISKYFKGILCSSLFQSGSQSYNFKCYNEHIEDQINVPWSLKQEGRHNTKGHQWEKWQTKAKNQYD